MGSIEKLASTFVQSAPVPIQKSINAASIKSSADIDPTKITASLDAMATCAKGAMNTPRWIYSHLVSIPNEIRLKHLINPGDILLPDTFPNADKYLSPLDELPALTSYTKGHLICNGDMQAKFSQKTSDFTLGQWSWIKALDDLISEAPPLDKDYIVYRGLIGQTPSQVKFVESLKEGMIVPHGTYVSCASKITPYTRDFLAKDGLTLADMRIKLPKGTRGLLLNDMKDEFVLPRNAQIKINSIDLSGGVIEAEYILPSELPQVPDDILRQIEESGVNNSYCKVNKTAHKILRKCLYNNPSAIEQTEDSVYDILLSYFSDKTKAKLLKEQFAQFLD